MRGLRTYSFIPSQIRHQIWTTGDSAPGAFPRKTQTRGQRKQNNLIDRISRRILASDQWIQSMTRPGRTWTIRAVNPRSFRIRSPLSSIESPQAARATEPPNTDLAPLPGSGESAFWARGGGSFTPRRDLCGGPRERGSVG